MIIVLAQDKRVCTVTYWCWDWKEAHSRVSNFRSFLISLLSVWLASICHQLYHLSVGSIYLGFSLNT